MGKDGVKMGEQERKKLFSNETGRVQLPFSKAIEISIRSLKIRFGRSLITASGVMLGIAFLVSVQGTSTISEAVTQREELVGDAQQIWLIAMSLLVCTVGITNAMLMSVTERFREIGTMKCLGALDKYIIELFLLESLFMGIAGSFVGVVLGLLASITSVVFSFGFGAVFSALPVVALLRVMLFSLVVGSLLSVAAAVYPAYTAAKMAPAEAMRVEV